MLWWSPILRICKTLASFQWLGNLVLRIIKLKMTHIDWTNAYIKSLSKEDIMLSGCHFIFKFLVDCKVWVSELYFIDTSSLESTRLVFGERFLTISIGRTKIVLKSTYNIFTVITYFVLIMHITRNSWCLIFRVNKRPKLGDILSNVLLDSFDKLFIDCLFCF